MILMCQKDLNDQAGMERAFQTYFRDIKKDCPGTLNDLLEARFVACDFLSRSLALSSETKPWMANPGDILHGGITAAYLDLVMGLICRYYSGGRMTRTVHTDVSYLRAIPIGKNICIEAKATKLGTGICFAEGRIYFPGETERLLATAVGTYSVQTPRQFQAESV